MIEHRAAGIHDHPHFKLGRRPPKKAPALMLADVLTGLVPPHPVSADHLANLPFGLYENDSFGDCGPTSAANYVRLVSAGLIGHEVQPTQDDVFDLYRRSGNPDFDPNTGQGDNGVDMQTMCEALHAGGIGGYKALCFAKVNVSSDAEIDAATSIFGGSLWGVNLLTPQQAQTDTGTWDYAPGPEWGGHAILSGAYSEPTWVDTVITWGKRVSVTHGFRVHQLEEAWVPIFQWHLDHPAFQAGVDVQALADAYHALTGKTIPNLPTPVTPPPPTPTPAPTPTPPPAPSPGGGGNDGPFLVGPFSDRVAARLALKAQKRGMTIEEYLTYHIKYGSGHWKN